MNDQNIEIRECIALRELAACVDLQRQIFGMPETEISPVRHFVVTKNAGGFVLGAFSNGEMIGFVLSVPAFLRGEKAFYSHMTGVKSEFQSYGVGASLKWAQRGRALDAGVKFLKWTFEPVKARNAYFNLEKLGAIISEYKPNFYGTDYATSPDTGPKIGLPSDRLFAEWDLDNEKVKTLAAGDGYVEPNEPTATIQIMNDWPTLLANDPEKARSEQTRIREEFQTAFGFGMTCRGFFRDEERPAYLLFNS